jgi:MscS family membrane protein
MGDWIKLGDVEGTVAEIGLRSTTIRTFDNALITIPNSIVSVSSVMNWSRRAVGRRIKLYVGVTYESDMNDIRQALNDIREMLKNHPDIANPQQKITRRKRGFKFSSEEDTHGIKSTQLVFMDKYNDFSIDILIYCFTRTVNWAEWLAVKEDVLFKIAEILKSNDLEFAYPTQVRINRSENNAELDMQLPTE